MKKVLKKNVRFLSTELIFRAFKTNPSNILTFLPKTFQAIRKNCVYRIGKRRIVRFYYYQSAKALSKI